VRNDLSVILIGACLLGAAWTVVLAVRNRRVGNGLLIELAVVELLVMAQLVVAVIEVAVGDRPDSTVTFLAYAVGALLVVPAGVFWSQTERSRSSTLVITVACLAVPVMTARMLQMWSSVGG
jgi:small-conductance mechanosensitive channel